MRNILLGMKVSSQVKSTFVHSQKYIEKELIPDLIKLRNTFILPPGTTEESARAVARQNGYAMYISHVSPEDEYFGIEGYYTQVDPDDEHAYTDSVHVINDRIITWITFLGTNEKEKLLATDLVKSYDVDGRATVSYTESFGVSKDESRYWEVPLINTGLDGLSFGGGKFGKGQKTGTTDKTAFGDTYDEEDDAPSKTMKIDVFNQGVTVKITPILSLDYNYNNGQNSSESKKVGFTLAPSTNSNLVVDVYRTRMDKTALQEMVDSLTATGLAKNEDKAKELFFQYITDENYLFLRRGGKSGEDFGRQGSLNGVCSYIGNNPTQYRSLVYRTRGGATSQPYEDERRTKYYFAGTLLDAKTIEIDRPRFWVEQASVSNVPYYEPARFILHIANESEAPALATTTAPFKLLISGPSNPNGAKISVDGMPLVGGLDVFLQPGVVTTKDIYTLVSE